MSEPLLTIAASNKNRLKLDELASQWFLKSIQWQDCQNFELLIADGGSDNYEEIKEYFEAHEGPIKMRIVQHKIGDVFLRALLNNVGVRNSRTEYIMTTDVDMLFARGFVKTLTGLLEPNCLIESRTMYLKDYIMKEIYDGLCDPYENPECLKRGRIKKRTTAGGCQCMCKDSWTKVRGFDETFYGWGSEDYDLYTRASQKARMIKKWMGESRETIELYHQHHHHLNLKKDLEYQKANKKRLAKSGRNAVNPDGWGGKKD